LNGASDNDDDVVTTDADAQESGAGALGDATVVDGRTRQQKQLDGLIGACKIALTTDLLPAAGGRRPQLLVTIDYKDLTSEVGRPGTSIFSGPLSAKTIRRIGCDADIIPVILSGTGAILDVGQSQRLFPKYMRLGIIARDGGCAFPGCTAPAPWTEVHHVQWFEKGGPTSVDNGVLVCGHHHHLLHQGDWRVEVRQGVPWFLPPLSVDPAQNPLRNHVWLKDARLPERLPEPAAMGSGPGRSGGPSPGGGPSDSDAAVRRMPVPRTPVRHSGPLKVPMQSELDIGVDSAAGATAPGRSSSPFDGWPAQPETPPF
jgi:hypothetical protein